jgi:hypothetical protein
MHRRTVLASVACGALPGALTRAPVAGFAAGGSSARSKAPLAAPGRFAQHWGAPVGAPAGAAPSDGADYPLVEIVAKDFSFAMPAEVPGGLTRFTLLNRGAFAHHVIFLRLRDGVSQAEIDAAAGEPDYLALLALGEPFGGPNAAPAGGAATAIVDLSPGDYRVLCVIGDDEGVPHYRHGMIAPLAVTPAPAARPAPEADLTVQLRDYAFTGLPSELPAGEHVWEITNAGPETHELVVFRQSPGVTFEMVLGGFGIATEATPGAGAAPPPGPPFLDVGGVTPMAAGVTNWALLDLTPGAYFAICFVLSPNRDHVPHFAFGMIQPLTIT